MPKIPFFSLSHTLRRPLFVAFTCCLSLLRFLQHVYLQRDMQRFVRNALLKIVLKIFGINAFSFLNLHQRKAPRRLT